eukprot:NODE_955_length_1073_cov_84.491211_g785_i0.p2 GENE.NODE_955_length_1073_cov_84.491211_g785_i0~~NODE_955_length_1073_cov_84.491211_g785_i0.p2  ORF type:complete len:226 (-),score=71.62 NODE_955_length_1073_cov_84.491211_g785_i0:364-1041(-)
MGGDMAKALRGDVVMSDALERMAVQLNNNEVPAAWAAVAYPSLKPLASWMDDLARRCNFLKKWYDDGTPAVFWISGFYFPQAFLTGTLQNYARKNKVAVDSVHFDYKPQRQPLAQIHHAPENGCYINGIYLEGARWDMDSFQLAESRPKELYVDLPVVWLEPVVGKSKGTTGHYTCPLYKTLHRAGTLSTTGHSTNFFIGLELPSDQPQEHWVARGVAAVCALAY